MQYNVISMAVKIDHFFLNEKLIILLKRYIRLWVLVTQSLF